MSENFYDQEKQLSQQGTPVPGKEVLREEIEPVAHAEKPKKKRYLSLEIAIWTWISLVIGFLLVSILASGWAALGMIIYGAFGAMIAFGVAFIVAIVELVKKRSWLPSISAMVLSSPVLFLVFNMFGF